MVNRIASSAGPPEHAVKSKLDFIDFTQWRKDAKVTFGAPTDHFSLVSLDVSDDLSSQLAHMNRAFYSSTHNYSNIAAWRLCARIFSPG